MKITIASSRIAFQLLIVIILAVSHLSSCRHLHTNIGVDDQAKKTPTTLLPPQLVWHFPATSPEASAKDQIDAVYGVSLRTVPGGPNPLHN
ncbi:conserved hypothetical protein [Ricinus communis]|uniref:Uncharacterized protein n=1 Tax=Ricinus communis TaxID=3988 RepID=B9RC72_RICCO|nr:conserved hypothetical protein [Ricinus communis]